MIFEVSSINFEIILKMVVLIMHLKLLFWSILWYARFRFLSLKFGIPKNHIKYSLWLLQFKFHIIIYYIQKHLINIQFTFSPQPTVHWNAINVLGDFSYAPLSLAAGCKMVAHFRNQWCVKKLVQYNLSTWNGESIKFACA